MRVLAFDTATRATSVALLDLDSGSGAQARDDPQPGQRPRHTSQLLPMIAAVLKRSGRGWEAVDLIAVGTGPGTFTGLRIGVATAQALARARDIRLVGVSTLRSLALGAVAEARDSGCDVVLPVLDARRREVFTAAWGSDPAGIASGAPALQAAEAIAPRRLAETGRQPGQRRLAVGDGAVEFRAILERPGTLVPGDDSRLHLVNAVHHCRLGAESEPVQAAEVRPEYLRLPDAELSLRAGGKS